MSRVPQNASSAHASGANNTYISGTPGGPDDTGAGPMVQTWILMEYCDRGCLQVRNTRGGSRSLWIARLLCVVLVY